MLLKSWPVYAILSAVLLLLWQKKASADVLLLLAHNIKANADDVLCLQCHPRVTENTMNYIHYPAGAGACSYCHIARPDHLQGDNPPGSVTIDRKAESCYVCHDRKDQNPVKHGAP